MYRCFIKKESKIVFIRKFVLFMRYFLPFIRLLSSLPLGVLYIFSDFIFNLNHYLIGYRRKVVYQNVKNSFPEKSEKEINLIVKKFFHNFTDYIVETLKSITITENEQRVRVQHLNQDVFHDAKNEGKNVIMLTGHVFNWEWISAFAKVIPQEHCHPVYRKINSSFWENEILKIRNKFGNESLEANDVIKHILRTPNDGNSVYMFVADQSPFVDHVDVGTTWLNQKTPVFVGYDKLSTRMDLAFIYCDMKKVKRGYYQVNYYRIQPDGDKFLPLEVVKKFHILLENTINKRPDNYLWSHRRWKYADAIKRMI